MGYNSAAVIGFDLAKRGLFIYPFEHDDGLYDVVVGTGYCTHYQKYFEIGTGATINSKVWALTAWQNPPDDVNVPSFVRYSRNPCMRCVLNINDAANVLLRFGINAGDDPTASDMIFFEIDNGTLYAGSSSGGNVTRDTITGVTLTNFHVFDICYLHGFKAMFYVDGVLVSTITSNLPGDDTVPLVFYITNTVVAERHILLYELGIQYDRKYDLAV